jgi:hypothetical protein
MAILSLMLVALATAMNYATRIWIDSVGTVDNFSKARVMLNIMDRDVQMMILRRDLPAFTDSTGTSTFAFYSMQQGPTATGGSPPDSRAISLVQYKLTPTATSSVLQRFSVGMNFAASGMTPAIGNTGTTSAVGFTTGTLTQLTDFAGSAGTPLNDNVANGVIAFQWQFVDSYGNILTPPYVPTNSTASPIPFAYDFVYPGDQANPRAVIVSMLVLSTPAYNLAVLNNTLNTLTQTCFSSTSAPLNATNPTYGQAWNAVLNAPSTTFLSLPAPERHGIEVFQRYIPLPVTTPSS